MIQLESLCASVTEPTCLEPSTQLERSLHAAGIKIPHAAWKDKCTPMFPAAPFTIAKTWKQTECSSTEEWIKKMWYIYTMEYYSAMKKNETRPSVAIDGPRECHTEWSKSDKGEISHDIPYMMDLKKRYKWIYLQNWRRLTDLESELMVAGGEGRDS